MDILKYWTATMEPVLCVIAITCGTASTSAQVNSWTVGTSGNWDQPTNWSSGVLPNSSQSVMITNSGWKAVAINSSTSINFSNAMSVSDVTIRGAWDTENTLLLNYVGTGVPLEILNGCGIGTNGTLDNFGSSLEVDGGLDVNGGAFVQVDGVTVVNGGASVLNGSFNTTNGNVTLAGGLILGSIFDLNSSRAIQNGGSLLANQEIDIRTGGNYQLSSGVLYAISGTHCNAGGTFIQTGGTNYGDVAGMGTGSYHLQAGMVQGNMMSLGNASFAQDDGLLSMQNISLVGGTCTFSGGIVQCGALTLNFVSAVTQSGGAATVTNDLTLEGSGNRHAPEFVQFHLSGGALSANRILMEEAGMFFQTNGSVNAANEIFVHDGGGNLASVYSLSGGNLFTSDATISSSYPENSSIDQSGGTEVITNQLSIYGTASYQFRGGTIVASNIVLTGSINLPPQFFVQGAPPYTITNESITLSGGAVIIQDSAQQFGRLTITSDSGINLAGSSAILRFADSHTNSWQQGVTPRLTVYNWNGSPGGGGADQLSFGTGQLGLSPDQLSQIQFSIGSNFYSAKILATGEVVPDQGSPTSGIVNSWTSPTSGNWDQPTNWSLGILPNSSQSIMITNAGWKAVAINPSTPTNFPSSMTISNLTIRGASNTLNTLLLNYVGTAVPLTVSNGVTLADNAQILNFNSGFEVESGTITVTNSQVIQDGGFVRTTNASMNLSDSQYQLTNGVFEGGVVWIGAPAPSEFNQYGGTATITTLDLGTPTAGSSGAYSLYGGNLNLPNGLTLMGPNNSMTSYFQSGGTNQTTTVKIEPGIFGISPSFKLNGGLLADHEVDIFSDNFGSAVLEQNGGTHSVVANVQINGSAASSTETHPAAYYLNGGSLIAPIVNLNANSGDARFIQTNGSAQVQLFDAFGDQSYYTAQIKLSGGTLSCSNLFSTSGGSIQQDGGVLSVSNTLGVLGYRNPGIKIYTRYTLLGGTLSASNIDISGEWIIGDSNGTNRISNPGYFSLRRFLQISNAVEQLGRFILPSSSTIDLAGSASRLSFAKSSGETWSSGATLTIANWNGNPAGGGADQLKFGTSQSGLTPAQLSQIQFSAGTNVYPAKILNTGEVVPDFTMPPTVAFVKNGNALVLTWPAGWVLQAATNVPGPYFDIAGATSPYTNDMALWPQRFFRLRQ
jgi:hypothetical protein